MDNSKYGHGCRGWPRDSLYHANGPPEDPLDHCKGPPGKGMCRAGPWGFHSAVNMTCWLYSEREGVECEM